MLPSTRHYISSSSYGRFGSYLEQQHFFATLFLALILHMGGFALYQILPKEAVEIVPVRVLNIKIGQPVTEARSQKSEDSIQKAEPKNTREMRVPIAAKKKEIPPAPPKPKAEPKKPVVQNKPIIQPMKAAPKPAIKKAAVVVKPKPQPQPQSQSQPKIPAATKGISIAEAALTQKAQESLTSKQYVREDTLANGYQATAKDENGKAGQGSSNGSAIGNSHFDDAEIESRYTQTLSLWLNRYKVYPAEARSAGLGGTVMLRIRINRQGRIMRYFLERSSGHDVIDHAISTMVNAANPVPAVPANYPDPRPYLEFLVPIHFKP